MKKFLGIILVIAVIAIGSMALFTACQGGGGLGNTDYSHTIVFYSSQGDALQQITSVAIARFEKKYPGWKVEHRNPGGYDQVKEKIQNDLGVQQQPDLAYCYADHVALYLQTGKVLNINDYINSTETITAKVVDENGELVDKELLVGYTADEVLDFLPGYYAEGKASNYGDYQNYGYAADDMLTLPFVKSTELMYYNADALIELGFYTEETYLDSQGNEKTRKVAAPAQTWDELWAHCETIINAKGYETVIPLGYDSEANWFITMCEQNGWGYTAANGTHYLFENENTVNWLSQLRTYYEKGYMTTQNDYQAYTSALFTKGKDGGCIYCIGSSGGASHQDPSGAFKFGVAPIPGSKLADGTINNKAISQGPSLVMFESGYGVANATEKQKMTFLFMKELLDPDFQATFAMSSGYNPSRASSYELDDYVAYMADTSDITSVAAKVASSMQDRFFTSPAFIGSSDARSEVGQALLLSIQGVKEPAKALKDAVRNCGGNK